MNKDQVRKLYKISNNSIRLTEAIDREITENSSLYVDELPDIQANLQHLFKNEQSMKEEFSAQLRGLALIEESGLGNLEKSSTYEGKVTEICRTCWNNLIILRDARSTTTADLELLIQNQENIFERVRNLLKKFTHQQNDSTISSEETHDSYADPPSEEIPDQLEQEKTEPFDIMQNYAMPFSPNIQPVASSSMTKLLSESKKEPIENKKLDVDVNERTIRTMMGQESKAVISSPEGDALRRLSFRYFVGTGTDLHLRKNTIYVAMLTLQDFLQVRIINTNGLKLLRDACLCLAARRYNNEVEVLLEHFKSEGINGKTLGRMERSIEKALDRKIHVVTPFVFSTYFLSSLCAHYSLAESRKDAIRFKSDKIILNVVEEGNLLIYKPSQIAVGAILLAYDDTLTVEAFKALPVQGFFDIVDLFKCYDQFRNLMKKGSCYFFL